MTRQGEITSAEIQNFRSGAADDTKDREIHEALLQTSHIHSDQLYRLASAAAWAGEGRAPSYEALTLAAQVSDRQTKALLAVSAETVHGGLRLAIEPGDDR